MKVVSLFKVLFLSAVFLSAFYIIEYGFTFDSAYKLITPFLLTGFTILIFFKPKFKLYILFLISACFLLMVISSLLNLINFSNILGGFGFSLLIVTIISYLPQIIKKGQIERF